MNIDVEFSITDNKEKVLKGLEDAIMRALERCGQQAESYAQDLVPSNKRKHGGTLKQSITHIVVPDERAVYVGTNLEYAPYVELGTGRYAEGGGGRQGWWVYVDGSSGGQARNPGKVYSFEEAKRIVAMLRSDGLEAYMTCGQPAQPFLKPALADHKGTYRNIIKSELSSG